MTEHFQFPIYLDLSGRRVLVVGGGKVGLRKTINLLGTHADIVVVSPEAEPSLTQLASEGKVEYRERAFEEADLDGAVLVFAATDDAELNQEVARLASKRGIPTNVATLPDGGDFIVPAQIRRGHFSLALATDGHCPAFSRALRNRLEMDFDEHWSQAISLLEDVRRHLHEIVPDSDSRQNIMAQLAVPDLPNRIRRMGCDRVREDLLNEIRDQT